MRAAALRAGLAVALLFLISGCGKPPEIRWAASLEAAQEEARRSRRLVMIDFYTDWCSYCKKMDQETYRNPAVARLMEQFVPVKLNAEKEGAPLAMKHGISSLPTTLFLDGAGKAVYGIEGFRPAEPFAEELKTLLRVLPPGRE